MNVRGWTWMGAALAALAAAGCSPSAENGGARKDRGPVPVRTAFVERRDVVETLWFTGELESPLAVEVKPKIQGRLEKLDLREGAEVAAGQVIAEIDRREAEAQVALAKAQAEQARVALAERERERRRLEALFAEAVATEQARDAAVTAHESAQAALEQAQAQLELARVALGETRLRAPEDGVVAARQAEPGALVGPATAIVKIVQMDPLRLVLAMPARLLPMLAENQTRLAVTTDVWPGQERECRLGRIYPEVDAATRTVRAEVWLDNPRADGDWPLRPGMYATAKLVAATSPNALAVPAAAVVRVLDRQVVFTVVDGTARATEVKTGIRSGEFVEILDGLAAGAEYVAMGQNKLTDGAAIERVAAAAE